MGQGERVDPYSLQVESEIPLVGQGERARGRSRERSGNRESISWKTVQHRLEASALEPLCAEFKPLHHYLLTSKHIVPPL